MEQEQTAFGFTSLILGSLACVGPLDAKIVHDAVKSIRLSEMEEWAAKEIGVSVQSQRKLIKNLVVKFRQEVSGIFEGQAMGF